MSSLAREPKATDQNENIIYKGKPEMNSLSASGARQTMMPNERESTV